MLARDEKADKATRNVRKASIHTRATASVRLGMCPRHRLFYFSAWIKVQPVDIRGGTKATHSSWVPFSELRADKAQSSANVRRGPRPRDHHSLDGSGEDVLLLGRGAIPHGTVAGPRGHYGVGYRTRLDEGLVRVRYQREYLLCGRLKWKASYSC